MVRGADLTPSFVCVELGLGSGARISPGDVRGGGRPPIVDFPHCLDSARGGFVLRLLPRSSLDQLLASADKFDMEWTDKVVVVTGAAGGIGQAFCRAIRGAVQRGLAVSDFHE